MICPRCTQEAPEGSRFCPACGLDFETVAEETAAPDAEALDVEIVDEAPAAEPADAGVAEDEDPNPSILHLKPTRNPKRPYLASTLAFFFGPFTYLYLEQAAWFWWGLLGGFVLILFSRGELIPLLVIGFMLHAYDVAVKLNESASVPASYDEPLAE
jgi:hypothetical protein